MNAPPRHRPRGFSLIELMIVCGLLGIAAAVSLPSLSAVLQSADAATASRQLHIHLSRARSAAISRRSHVVLCPADRDLSKPRCDESTNWTQGWWVFADEDEDQSIGDEEKILAFGQPLRPRVRIRQGRGGRPRAVRFKPQGDAWPNTSFYVCTSAEREHSRRVIVYRSGRSRIAGTGKKGCLWVEN